MKAFVADCGDGRGGAWSSGALGTRVEDRVVGGATEEVGAAAVR